MGRDEIRTAIEGAVDYLTRNPGEARYTDSYATARLDSPDALTVSVEGPNGAHIATDMPVSVGGQNSTTSSGWYMRAAEAACVATLVAMRAAQLGVALSDLEVTVDSESDDQGILGIDATVPAGPLHTRVAVSVHANAADGAPADDDLLRDIVSWAVEHCPVTDAVKRAIPMTVEVSTD